MQPVKEAYQPNPEFTLQIAEGVYYDPTLRNVHCDGKILKLSQLQHNLLRLLYMHEHSTIDATRLNTALHGEGDEMNGALKVVIHALRTKLGSNEHTPEIIQTNLGGYRLGDPQISDHSKVSKVVSDTLYDEERNVHAFLNGEVIYDSTEGIVQVGDTQNQLSEQENIIMHTMTSRRPQYTDTYDFMLELEEHGYNPTHQQIAVHINALRGKVQVKGDDESLIKTKKNMGYKIYDYGVVGREADTNDENS